MRLKKKDSEFIKEEHREEYNTKFDRITVSYVLLLASLIREKNMFRKIDLEYRHFKNKIYLCRANYINDVVDLNREFY
mgnify:CR=1 FL=1